MAWHPGEDGKDERALGMKKTNTRCENRELDRRQVVKVRGLHPRLHVQVTWRTSKKAPHSSPVPRDLDSASVG